MSDIGYSFRTAASYRISRSIEDSATDGKEFAAGVSPKKEDPGLHSEDRDRFVIEPCGRIKLPHWRRRQD